MASGLIQRSAINAGNLLQYLPLLQKQGLLTPEQSAAIYSAGENGWGGIDLSNLNGWTAGQSEGPGGIINSQLFDPSGALSQTHDYAKAHESMTGKDWADAALHSVGVIAAGYGIQGALGAAGGAGGGTGALGTIGAGGGEVGALGTVGQFAMPELGAVAAPSATLAGETAGLTAGQVGALGGGGIGTLGSGGSLASTGLGSTALPTTAMATAPTFAPTAATMGSVAGGGLGEYASAIKAAASLVGGLGSAYSTGQAGQQASQLQQQAATAGQAQLAPYATAGTNALSAQQDLAGLNGPEKQAAAIAALKASPEFTASQDLGERSILANASATGGLRGGNTQAALAQFSPALLAQLINQQYGRLGSMTNTGLSAAGGVSNLIQQGGAAAAGGALAGGKQQSGYWGALGNAAGLYAGLQGW